MDLPEYLPIADLPENEQEAFTRWLRYSDGEYTLDSYERWKERPDRIRRECFRGWDKLIDSCEQELLKIGVQYSDFSQIKQKFGGLRIHLDVKLPPDTMAKARHTIEIYIKLASSVCEYCGSDKGQLLSNGGCYRTICPDCNQSVFEGGGKPSGRG